MLIGSFFSHLGSAMCEAGRGSEPKAATCSRPSGVRTIVMAQPSRIGPGRPTGRLLYEVSLRRAALHQKADVVYPAASPARRFLPATGVETTKGSNSSDLLSTDC